jgi:catechol 2,3-dioxygenase-like lactoylglutathione lyase family enzyme
MTHAGIYGVHLLLFSRDPEADRAFFREVLNWRCVDAGEGWLIFSLPPTELGVHPEEGSPARQPGGHDRTSAMVYLMCGDLHATVEWLAAKGVFCTEAQDAGWGITTTLRLPSGASLGLYQPRHPLAIDPRTA